MAVAGLVVQRGTPLQRVRNGVHADLTQPIGPRLGGYRSHLQRVQGNSRVAVGNVDQVIQGVRRQSRVHHAQTAALILQGTLHNPRHILRGQGLQGEYPAPGQERRVDLKGRVFRGGADEYDRAVFHVGENHVLLRLVEPVNLVHEQDGRLPVKGPPFLRSRNRLAEVGHAGRHRRNRLKVRPGDRGD